MHGNSGGGTFLDSLIDFTAGSLGAVASVCVGQPLDTVKVKLQTFPQLYTGPWNCFSTTFRLEGLIRGLYAGTAPAIAANVAENSVLFAFYGVCQKFMTIVTNTPKIDDLSMTSNATAGFLAAFFSSFSLCPTELIKVRLQASRELALAYPHQKMPQVTAYQMTKCILKDEGVRGMFKGLGPTMLREMPGYFVFFGAYEGTRSLLAPKGGSKNDCGPIATMVAGAAGGVALWTAVFPADLVKSRIQINCSNGTTFITCAHHILRTEGFLALYSGLSPTLVRTIPATAVLFLTFENSKKLFHKILD